MVGRTQRGPNEIGFRSIRMVALACLAIICFPCFLIRAQETEKPKRVLVLYWYGKDLLPNVLFEQSFHEVLQKGPIKNVEYYSEYLESNRFEGEAQEQVFRDYLKRRYADRPIDVVVAVTGAPLEFLLKYRADLFPDAPIVFEAIDRPSHQQLAAGPGMTGVIPASTHKQTLDLALRLHPDTKQVFVISGNLEHDKSLENIARNELADFENRVRINYLTDLTPADLVRTASSLPKHSIILYVWQQARNEKGEILETFEILPTIASSSSAPVYGMGSGNVGRGLVGGYVSGPAERATTIAEMTVRILNGERAQNIPVEDASASFMFDWRELQRWKINESSLPAGSVVLFRQPSFWELYKWYIVSLVTACLVEALLIAWLLFTRARRRQAEEDNERLARIAEAERQELDEVVSNVPGVVWETRIEPGTNERKTTFISAYIENMLGYTPEEWLSAPPGFGLRLMPEDEDRQRVLSDSEAVIASGRKGFTQYRWRAKDGRIVWVETYLIPILDESGKAVGLRGVTLDITDRKQGEEMLRRKQLELSGIIGSAMDAIITIDESQRILLFNAAAEKIFECTATEAIGQPLEQFIPQRFRFAHRNHIQVFGDHNVTRRSMGLKSDLWGLRASGEEFPIEASISRINVDREKFYTVILRDVTQRKLAEEVLRQSEERFAKAFRANPQPMSLSIISGGRYLDVNESFLAMSGYTREEVIGHTSLELKVWADAQTRADFVQQLLDHGSAVNIETKFRTKDGSFRVLLSSGESLEIGGEKCLLLASSDITERKNVEEALRAAHEEVSRLKNQLEEENTYLREEINLEHNFGEIVGRSDALKYVLFKVEQVAPTETTVLITGETGTGKELVARAIHNASDRSDRQLVRVNCAALSPSVIESEFFGHEKGAFTGASTRKIGRFELANGATIFLDEIGELSTDLQVKLLRVIQEGEFERLGSSNTIKVDLRIIAATNRNLDLEVKKGTFREDLWYRLNVFPITVPPLRQRRDDIPLLVEHFAKRFAAKMGKAITSVSPATLKILCAYSWPGNVRELANVIERAVINSNGPVLRIGDDFSAPQAGELTQTNKTLEELERDYIVRMLNEAGWRIEGPHGAARILGINPSTLRARIAKLGIQKPRQAEAKTAN